MSSTNVVLAGQSHPNLSKCIAMLGHDMLCAITTKLNGYDIFSLYLVGNKALNEVLTSGGVREFVVEIDPLASFRVPFGWPHIISKFLQLQVLDVQQPSTYLYLPIMGVQLSGAAKGLQHLTLTHFDSLNCFPVIDGIPQLDLAHYFPNLITCTLIGMGEILDSKGFQKVDIKEDYLPKTLTLNLLNLVLCPNSLNSCGEALKYLKFFPVPKYIIPEMDLMNVSGDLKIDGIKSVNVLPADLVSLALVAPLQMMDIVWPDNLKDLCLHPNELHVLSDLLKILPNNLEKLDITASFIQKAHDLALLPRKLVHLRLWTYGYTYIEEHVKDLPPKLKTLDLDGF